MWLFQSFEHGLFTVGFYTPEGKWKPESDHTSRDAAAARCNYLNGGSETTEVTGSYEQYQHLKTTKL